MDANGTASTRAMSRLGDAGSCIVDDTNNLLNVGFNRVISSLCYAWGDSSCTEGSRPKETPVGGPTFDDDEVLWTKLGEGLTITSIELRDIPSCAQRADAAWSQ